VRSLVAVLVVTLVPAAALAAEEGGAADFWWKLFNFTLLVVVLVVVARKPVLNALAERRGAIQRNLEASEKLLAESQQKLAELSAKTERLDADVEEIKAATRRSAEKQKEVILADAAAAAERMRAAARGIVEREVRRAREELRAETITLASDLARQLLEREVNEADRGRLVEEFITRLERGEAR
jgi:F-type H+-transporting ATPase subunit b